MSFTEEISKQYPRTYNKFKVWMNAQLDGFGDRHPVKEALSPDKWFNDLPMMVQIGPLTQFLLINLVIIYRVMDGRGTMKWMLHQDGKEPFRPTSIRDALMEGFKRLESEIKTSVMYGVH